MERDLHKRLPGHSLKCRIFSSLTDDPLDIQLGVNDLVVIPVSLF